ncbi:Flagellar two-component response regulator FleR [hydrothermal vent metagenome]|uniref:Flagellar two-component response regulator FleR n=1 Tax=hydrothermal vent metagenome TaxID=652676 RepID=A0A3B0QY32_9ZZZZ
MNSILVVDDEVAMGVALKEALTRKGYSVDLAVNGDEALKQFSNGSYSMVISDMQMPGQSGMELLKEIKRSSPLTPVLLITAYGTVEKAVEAIKEGAIDFMLKPFSLDCLEAAVERALKTELNFEVGGKEMLTRSHVMNKVVAMAETVAGSDATVMLSGESGTGKELMARFIHAKSERADGPFIAVNCASIPESLLESELFGHEKGAFTGALAQRQGKFEQANGGTILLDEISEMDLKLQAKLLRVIQEREVERVGGKETVMLDIRIIATTNRNLEEEVLLGGFREDLYYRLNIFPLRLPPLRERTQDVEYLAEHFMASFSAKYARHIEGISKRAMERLKTHGWPGNIRELENTIERAVLLASGCMIETDQLELKAGNGVSPAASVGVITEGEDITISEMEKRLIIKTLDGLGGNRTRAAAVLGISVRTLRNKLKEYG